MRKIIIAIKLPLNVTSFKIKVLFARFKYARTHLQLKAYAAYELQMEMKLKIALKIELKIEL